jgi:hypothetical protein
MNELVATGGNAMTERTITQLLAGVLDLAPAGAPPHPPGPCAALCVPTCTGSRPASAAPTRAVTKEERLTARAGAR